MDVGDWIPMLMTSFKCWWQKGFKRCHLDISSPTSVTKIDITLFRCRFWIPEFNLIMNLRFFFQFLIDFFGFENWVRMKNLNPVRLPIMLPRRLSINVDCQWLTIAGIRLFLWQLDRYTMLHYQSYVNPSIKRFSPFKK